MFKTQVQKPTWYQLSIDEYNAMVDEYNRNTAAFNETRPDYVEEEEGMTRLEDSYLENNEGNPYGYIDTDSVAGFERLNDSNVQLGKNGGSSTLGFGDSTSEAKGTECSHGVSVDLTM